MEITNTVLLIFLELTFVFVVLLLLHSQKKSIGEIPFFIMLGMLLVFGEFLGGSEMSFNALDYVSFQISPVVVFVPFMAAMLLVYISDGVLSMQRMIIGSLVTMGVFFYLGDLSRLQMRWVTYSVTGTMPLEAFDFLLERTRRSMLAVVCGQLAALFIMPVIYSRLRNTGKNLFISCAGAMGAALLLDSLISQLVSGSLWSDRWSEFTPLLLVRLFCGVYLAILLALYISKMGRESDSRQVKPLEIFFAFFGSYGRSKALEANILEWEGRYRLILENASEMIVIADRNGVILDANPAAERKLKSPKAAGESFFSYLNEEDSRQFKRAIRQAGIGKGSTGQFYVELADKKSGEEKTVTYMALTVTALNIGALEAFIIMGRDITEERKLEAEKQRLNEELAHSQRLESLGQLAGGVAHDFNNNIHAILGHADLIGFNSQLDDRTRKHLEKIIEIAEQSGGLTSQLLGFARKGKYRESDFDLRVLIQRTAELFMPGSTDIEVAVQTAEKPLLVSGDQIQLQQVILNLLINARDALRMTADRDYHLEIKALDVPPAEVPPMVVLTEELQKASSVVLISIADNGCGMDENTMKRMFEPFFTTKPVGQGTGMGMAMAYGTVKSHHGVIGVDSVQDRGTEICIVLPKLHD
ncbi:MAG: PAS domain S-box protein [Lentisphaeria bacterium]|nr:PAS domain S-box protein [Lentisphaeria bacterium]